MEKEPVERHDLPENEPVHLRCAARHDGPADGFFTDELEPSSKVLDGEATWLENSKAIGMRDACIVVVGFPLHRALPSRASQLAVMVALFLLSSAGFAALQERALYVPGFRFTGWMAQLTSLTYVVISFAERVAVGDLNRAASMVEYLKLSVLTMGGMYLTNWSLRYLSYPLRVVFKSSKLLPVMLLSVAHLGKRYSFAQYMSVGLLVFGMALFLLGDAKGRASIDARGIALVATGSLLEALAATYEEKRFFGQLGCSPAEVQLYSSLLGFCWAALADLLSGDFMPAVQHSMSHPETIYYIMIASAAGAIAQSIILNLIKHFGSTLAELVKTCRKIMTVLISFALFGKPWTLLHVAGGFLFTASIAVERYAEGGRARRFAGALVATSMAGVTLLLSSGGPSTYSVVVDAGSIGTRLHVYRFDAWTSKLLDVGAGAQLFVARKPGINAFLQNASGVGPLLLPLVQAALTAVPLAQRAMTPLALRATAGLRLPTPTADSDRLLGEARRVLSESSFADGGVVVMDGVNEGVYLWTSVNYLMGTFAPGMQAIRDPLAVLALNAGAVQMVYLLAESDATAAERSAPMRPFVKKVALPLGSGFAHLYQNRYADYGLMVARGRSLREVEGAPHACLPLGTAVTWEFGRERLDAQGAATATECEALVRRMLESPHKCPVTHKDKVKVGGACTLGGTWGGPGIQRRRGQRWLLTSYFSDRLRDVGMVWEGEKECIVTRERLERVSRQACDAASSGLPKLEATFPRLPEDGAAWLCFDLAYIVALLEALAIEPDAPLIVASEIRGFQVSWALGVAIEGLMRRTK